MDADAVARLHAGGDERLREAVGLRVFVENAPIACALSQMWLGMRGHDAPADFAYVTVSDGVGAGVVVSRLEPVRHTLEERFLEMTTRLEVAA